MRLILYIFVLVLTSGSLSGQRAAEEESSGLLYRKEVSGGLMIQTRGWGLYGQYGVQKNYKYINLYSLRLGNIKHPKEVRSFTGTFLSDAKSYFYGKLNAVIVARPGFGGRYYLSEKLRQDPVGISFQWSVGPSLAFLKPVYLEIRQNPSSSGGEFVSERYDPESHPQQVIYGRDRWIKGINEVAIEPGAFASASFYFDISLENDKVLGLELGTYWDFYFNELPIMANTNNLRIYPTLFATIVFGQKMF